MTSTTGRTVPLRYSLWRRQLLIALQSFRLSDPSETIEQLNLALQELPEIREHMVASSRVAIELFGHLLRSFVSLCAWLQASLAADATAERHLSATRAHAALASDMLPEVDAPQFSSAAHLAARLLRDARDPEHLKAVAAQLQKIAIPVAWSQAREMRPRPSVVPSPEEPARTEDGPFVIKIMLDLEGRPWSTPQVLLAGTIYDLAATVTVPRWPNGTDRLAIDCITTLAPEHHRICLPCIERSEEEADGEHTLGGHVEFPVPQDLLSEPVVVRLRATFLSTTDQSRRVPATIVGYHQLRVRISDGAHTPLLTRYRSIDARIVEIVDEIERTLPDLDRRHLNDFVEALVSIANYLGVSLQQGLYRDGLHVDEAHFQQALLYHMRSQLGEEVREAPKQGAGITDIQYRSVTVELKVEKETSDRSEMVPKYLSQLVQYSSAGGAQLGILCILDVTEKVLPPAGLQNQITLETPPLHGFPQGEAPFPAKIAAVVIDGGLRAPSSYSS